MRVHIEALLSVLQQNYTDPLMMCTKKKGKTSKKEKNTAVIFQDKRVNQILQSYSENKTNWQQRVVSGVFLEASFIVIMIKKDKHCVCHKKGRFLIPLKCMCWCRAGTHYV